MESRTRKTSPKKSQASAEKKSVKKNRLGKKQKEELLIELSRLYCDARPRKLSDIARQLSISRPTAKRLFTEAKERNYIREFRALFQPPVNRSLAHDLEVRFKLADALVVDIKGDFDEVRSALASQTVQYLIDVVFADRSLEPMHLGICGGAAAQKIVDRIPPEPRKITVVPLGAIEIPPTEKGPVSLSLNLAQRFKEQPKVKLLISTEITTAKRWGDDLRSITQLQAYQQLLESWRTLNVCIFTVNPFDSQSQGSREFAEHGFLGDALSDVAYIFNGDFLDSEFRSVANPLASIPVEIVKELAAQPRKRLILVAGGQTYIQKAPRTEAIKQVLNRGLANVLITDDETAQQLLG